MKLTSKQFIFTFVNGTRRVRFAKFPGLKILLRSTIFEAPGSGGVGRRVLQAVDLRYVIKIN